ncbi:MAG: hypothetical protein IT372_06820 [Polyangiaceae bacterium]|nr:hypothetical protein [Polyangiaceae bacterium]
MLDDRVPRRSRMHGGGWQQNVLGPTGLASPTGTPPLGAQAPGSFVTHVAEIEPSVRFGITSTQVAMPPATTGPMQSVPWYAETDAMHVLGCVSTHSHAVHARVSSGSF